MSWFVWRPILAGVTTLREIQEFWSLKDLMDANEALDVKAEMEDLAMERAKEKQQ